MEISADMVKKLRDATNVSRGRHARVPQNFGRRLERVVEDIRGQRRRQQRVPQGGRTIGSNASKQARVEHSRRAGSVRDGLALSVAERAGDEARRRGDERAIDRVLIEQAEARDLGDKQEIEASDRRRGTIRSEAGRINSWGTAREPMEKRHLVLDVRRSIEPVEVTVTKRRTEVVEDVLQRFEEARAVRATLQRPATLTDGEPEARGESSKRISA